MKHKKIAYETITGRGFDLTKLGSVERRLLLRVFKEYQKKPDWTWFAANWGQRFDKAGLPTESPVYRICQDLEARLGIAQGKVAPPDYRDYLADLIEEQYGTRYQFCKATGFDPGHLSRVFSSRSDLSLESLGKLLHVLHAVLVVQPEKSLRSRSKPERVERPLAALAN